MQRNQWQDADWTSLIGHDNVVDVAVGATSAAYLRCEHCASPHLLIDGPRRLLLVKAFNPRLFLRDPKKPATGNNVCDVVAVAARSVISIWLTSQIRPVVVFDTIVDREVLDLSW